MKRPQYILHTILLMTLSLLFAACEKEIRLDLGNYKPRIVMNGIISPDSLIEVRVSKSFLYTDTFTEKSRLGNATLTLYINGEEREKMVKIGTESNTNHDRLGFQYTALMTLFRSTV
ncbi:MAG: DUF4249 family protein, partial [Proteiniphilum sp.]|nr:DUF4249 family protein [Proteiniphilum sp.]